MSRRRKRRSAQKPQPPTRVERSAGGVVWRREGDSIQLLIIRDSHGNWALPKGRIEEGESPEAAARREVGEETMLSALVLTAELGTTDFWFEDKWEVKGERVHKFISYFLYELTQLQPVVTSIDEHVQGFTWASPAEFATQLTYKSLGPVVKQTLEHLTINL